MSSDPPTYTIDTCSLTAMRRIYPQDVFPGAWAMLASLAQDGSVIATEDVLEELKVQDDEVLEWAQSQSHIFLPLDEPTMEEARRILKEHPTLIDLKRRKSGADPFVIASARVNNCAVVTEEKKSGGPHRVKIPDVCRVLGIECISILEMFRREGLRL